VQVVGESEAVYSLHILLWCVVIVVVDDAADSDVGAHHERLRQSEHAVAAASPVVVLHLSAIHRPDAAGSLHAVGCVDHSVVERHHYACGLEHRTRFEQVAYSVVLYLVIVVVGTLRHVDDGFDVAGLHLHHDSHAHIGVDESQLLEQCAFGEVLHRHVDSSDDVGAVLRRRIRDVEISVQHLASVPYALYASKERVVREFESALCGILCAEHLSDGAACERTVRQFASVMLLPVETALIGFQTEHGQTPHF